jgi:hypothetical protein
MSNSSFRILEGEEVYEHHLNSPVQPNTSSQADGLLITAGAGMGVDSGLPDFRGKNGFWRAYPALGAGTNRI